MEGIRCGTFEGFDGGLVGEVVTGVDDADALGPVDAEGGPQDVDSSAALVPLGGRFCLDGAVGAGADETGFFDQLGRSFNQRWAKFHRSFTIEKEKINK